ncbi:uncharacterized protein [Dysidea avara]
MVDSSHSNTEHELSLGSSSSVGVTIDGEKVVYTEEEVEKKRSLAREKAERISGIHNPLTTTDGGDEKEEKSEKSVENGKVPKDKQNFRFENLDDKPFEKYLKYFYLGIAIVMVIVVFLLPLIFYYTDQPDDFSIIDIPINLDTCSASFSTPSPTACVDRPNSGCSIYPDCYICKHSLSERALAANVSEVPIVLDNPIVDGLKDGLFRETAKSLRTSLTSDECRDKLMSFMCAFFNTPCNVNSSEARLVSPTGDECREVRDELCVLEWQLLERSISQVPGAEQFNIRLPNCSEFDGEIENETAIVQCADQFGKFCGFFCLPLCEEFSQNSDGSILLQDILFIFAAVSSLIGGTIVIIISIYRRTSMLHFPSILIVYQTVCVMTISFFLLLPFPAGRDNLFCSERSLIDAYKSPTAYCQASGFVVHAAVLLMHFFWIMHLLHMFTRLAFPMKARNFDQSSYRHWFHIVEVGGAMLVAIIPPIAVVSASEYNVPSFPANYCVPEPRVAYYTELLPINVILGAGVCLIVTIFWMLHQRDGIFKASTADRKGKCNILELTTPEFKLLLLFSYYVLFGVLFLTTSTLIVRNYDSIYRTMEDYAVCQSKGADPKCDDIRDELDGLNYPGLLNTCYILMAVLNVTNLIFVLQFRDIKYQVKKLSVVARRYTIDRLGSTSVSN